MRVIGFPLILFGFIYGLLKRIISIIKFRRERNKTIEKIEKPKKKLKRTGHCFIPEKRKKLKQSNMTMGELEHEIRSQMMDAPGNHDLETTAEDWRRREKEAFPEKEDGVFEYKGHRNLLSSSANEIDEYIHNFKGGLNG